jgi:glutaredoxin
VVLIRQQCHLCDQALAVVDRVCAETGDTYKSVDIDTDPDLQRQYIDQVPVTFVGGRQHDFWRVSESRLRAALGA